MGKPAPPSQLNESDHRSDEELLRAYVDGDDQAFCLIVERYERRLLEYACGKLWNREAEEDAVQLTFAALAKKASTVEKVGRYLWGTCRRTIAQLWRVELRRRATEATSAETNDPPGASGDWAFLFGDENLVYCIGELDSVLREAVLMRYVDELTYEEIGERQRAVKATVWRRVREAIRLLKQCLKTRGVESSDDLSAD